MATGVPLRIEGTISPGLLSQTDTIQDILCSWRRDFHRVRIDADGVESRSPASGTSVFFSGGVDSFYSLFRHFSAVSNLLLVHGFDVDVNDVESFKRIRESAQAAADLFSKRLIVVSTDIRRLGEPCCWGLYHGAALASVAHALAPQHGTVLIGSSYDYSQLHVWGSHPLLDPLWSSEAVQFIHDGTGSARLQKVRFLAEHPECLPFLRVCWRDAAAFNCGVCEKCLRTKLALSVCGVMDKCRFERAGVTARDIRGIQLDHDSARFWREFLAEDCLPASIKASVTAILRDERWGLPPSTAKPLDVLRRVRHAFRICGEVLRDAI